MTARYITTSGEFNQLIPTYANGDDVYIQNGVSCTMAHSPNFMLSGIYLQDESTLIIDGVNGTAPISIHIDDDLNAGPGSTITTTQGWHIIGTSDGSLNQTIDLDTIYRLGGGPSDIPLGSLPMIQAECGHTFLFTEGTGREPVKGEWLTTLSDPFIRYGYVYEAGTNSGTGYIKTKYTVGTIADAEEICVFGWEDRRGPSYERIWSGTASGTPKVAEDVWHQMFNIRLRSGGNAGAQFLRDKAQSFCFDSYGTSLNLSDGTWGNVLQDGARLRVPGINFVDNTVALYTAGTSTDQLTSSGTYLFGDITFSNILIDGANLCYIFPNTAESYSFKIKNTGMYRTYIIGHNSTDFEFSDSVILSTPYNSSYESFDVSNLQTTGTIAGCTIAALEPYSSGYNFRLNQCFLDDSSTLYITDNIIANPYDGVIDSRSMSLSSVNNIYMDNNIIINEMLLDKLKNPQIINTKYSLSKTGGVDTSTKYIMDASSGFTGDFIIKGLQYIDDFVPGEYIFRHANMVCDSFTLRCLGSPHAPLKSSSYSNTFFYYITGDTGTLDIARCFFDQNSSWTQTLGLPNQYQYRVLYKDVITPRITAATVGGVYFRGYNVSARGCVWNPGRNYAVYSSTLTGALAGTHWNHMYSAYSGGIYALFTPATALSNPYVTISGNGFLHQDNNQVKMKAGDIVEMVMDYFAKGFTSLTGQVTYFDNYTSWGNNDWSGDVDTYFQYDTGGTGFNGSWIATTDSAALQGLDIQSGTGLKLKLRFECNTDASNMYGIAFTGNYSYESITDHHNWETIDQTVTSITLDNLVVGSRYWIYDNTNGALLTSGAAASSTVSYDVNNLPNGTSLKIRVRYASDTIKYLPFETLATVSNLSANIYVSQIEDDIAS